MPGMRARPSKIKYFMDIAEAVKERSPDPKTQVGAVVVDPQWRIVATGYNGPPPGFDDDSVDWFDRETIYPIVVHAEVNAIVYSRSNFVGSKLIVTLSPCKECIKLVASAGITEVVYKRKYKDFDIVDGIASLLKVKLTQYEENDVKEDDV